MEALDKLTGDNIALIVTGLAGTIVALVAAYWQFRRGGDDEPTPPVSLDAATFSHEMAKTRDAIFRAVTRGEDMAARLGRAIDDNTAAIRRKAE